MHVDVGSHVGGSKKATNKNAQRKKLEAKVSVSWRGIVDGSALIGSYSPISRALSSRNYKPVFPSAFSAFAFLFLFGLVCY